MREKSKFTPPKRGFSHKEFEYRLIEAQKIMLRDSLDAILVTSPPNFRYFTGFDSQFWESPTRPWFLVIPLNKKPIAIIPEIGEPAFANSWIEKILTWPAPTPEDDGISLLADTFNKLPFRFGKLGCEFGREMAIRMPIIDLDVLRGKVPLNFVDGSPSLWDIRVIKTPAEINHIQHICTIVSNAYEEAPNLLSLGITEREASKRLRIDILNRGADSVPFLPAISGPGGVKQIVCGPGDRLLEEGDILFIDTGSTYDGYFCDFDRNFAIGKISSQVAQINELLWRATEAGIKAAVPGKTTGELWWSMNKVLEDALTINNNVGRMGHGLGLQLTEPPSHRYGGETVIKENMVLTIEPGIEYLPGKMLVHEENIVVTEAGAQLLTKRAPMELPIIS